MRAPSINNAPGSSDPGAFARPDHELFSDIGTCLFGPQYRSELARKLDVHLRTLMRYDTGERRIPEWVWLRLIVLLDEQRNETISLTCQVMRRNGN